VVEGKVVVDSFTEYLKNEIEDLLVLIHMDLLTYGVLLVMLHI